MNLNIKKFEALEHKHIKELDMFIYNHKHGMAFHTSEWLLNIFPKIFDSNNETFFIFDDNKLIGVFPLYLTENKIFLQRISYCSPLFSAAPVIDLALNEEGLIEVSLFIKEYLKKEYPNILIKIVESSVQTLNNYSYINYISNTKSISHQMVFLPNNEESLKPIMKYSFRRKLNKFDSTRFTYLVCKDVEEKMDLLTKLLECYKLTYEQKYEKSLDDLASIENLYTNLLQNEFVEIHFIKEKEKIIAYSIVICYKDYAYYSDGFVLRDKEYNDINANLHYFIMKSLISQKIKYYDLGIENLNEKNNYKKNIFKFKMSMGAKLVFSKKTTYYTNKIIDTIVNRIMEKI